MRRAGPRRSLPIRRRLPPRLSPASPGVVRWPCRCRHCCRPCAILYGVRRRMGSRMSARFKTFPELKDQQAQASDPAVHASLSASAGTGKTQVLTARVLRLLLKGARPESILCLTFTKAAAAEMANRIGLRLASWVRRKRSELWSDLEALGERPDDR